MSRILNLFKDRLLENICETRIRHDGGQARAESRFTFLIEGSGCLWSGAFDSERTKTSKNQKQI